MALNLTDDHRGWPVLCLICLPREGTEMPVPDYVANIGGGIKGLRVGVLGGYFADRVDPEVLDAAERAVWLLRELGATTEATIAPFADELLPIQRAIVLPEASGVSQFWLTVWSATRPRATFSRMLSAVAVQTSGLGSLLCAAK